MTEPRPEPKDRPREQQAKPQQGNSVAAQLVRHALNAYRLGVTDAGDAYGVHYGLPHIARPLRGGRVGLRAELAKWFFVANKTVASAQALADCCATLEGYAAEADSQRVYLRVGELSGTVFIDMGDTAGHVIEIGSGTWDIALRAPVLFRRTKLTGELPKPYVDGDLTRLWEFVPIAEADRPLLLAWMVQALIQPDTAHPIPALLAEQGSAKSTVTRCLVDLIDPSPVPLRKAPRDAESWVVAAAASWVVALDNLSGDVPQWLSDSLCRAVTGDGDVRRALYTDADVSVIAFRRVPVINGIDLQIMQGDLAERILPIELPRVTKRRNDAELTAAWADARPDVLGGLLSLAADVHHRLPSVTVTNPPRMADFAQVLAAVDEILATDGLARYRERAKRVAADTLDVPFIAALVDQKLSVDNRTSAELLALLNSSLTDSKPPKDWPRNARSVTSQLTRHAPALRALGWLIEDDGGRNHRNRVQWTIRQPEKVSNPDSQPSQDSLLQVDDELDRELNASQNTAASYLSGTASQRDGSDSQLKSGLNREDELASHASQQSRPSLASPPHPLGYVPPIGPDRCRHCGHHLPTQGHATNCSANPEDNE